LEVGNSRINCSFVPSLNRNPSGLLAPRNMPPNEGSSFAKLIKLCFPQVSDRRFFRVFSFQVCCQQRCFLPLPIPVDLSSLNRFTTWLQVEDPLSLRFPFFNKHTHHMLFPFLVRDPPSSLPKGRPKELVFPPSPLEWFCAVNF